MRYQAAPCPRKKADEIADMHALPYGYGPVIPGRQGAEAEMRVYAAMMLTVLMVAACSSKTPPVGRWEGTYETSDTLIAARMEIDSKGEVFVSAPDATDIGAMSGDDRANMRQKLAQGMAAGWGDVAPRHYDFDGSTFRKPGGIAPQMEWHSSDNTMAMHVYLGTNSIEVALHPVKTFSGNPWAP
jgi:hypothetical protein